MPTYAQAIDLVDDPALIAEYEAHHRAVWPEVLEALEAGGIRSMRIWRLGTRLVMVMTVEEGFDVSRYEGYARSPRVREWEALMRRYQRAVPGGDGVARWVPMEEVFAFGVGGG